MSAGSSTSFSSRPERVGRDGLLDLGFVRETGHTVLARRRFTHPLQTLAPLRAPDGSPYVMMLNQGGGLVGGDRLRTVIEIGPEAEATLLTASATRVYRTTGAPVVQSTEITLHPGAILEYLPDHVIPHPGAILHQSLRVDMAPGSRAIIYDALAAGRVGRGERWLFQEIKSSTLVTLRSHPTYLNRAWIVPDRQDLDRLGCMQGWNYTATLLALADGNIAWSAVADLLDCALCESPDIVGGVSETAAGCVVRLMAASADALINCFIRLWGVARRALLGREPFTIRKL